MISDEILREIRSRSDPQYEEGMSWENWTEIWNSACDEIAEEFEAEGLMVSADNARRWKDETK